MLPCFFLLSGRALTRPAKLQSDGTQVGHGKECIVNIEMRRLDAITPYAANAKRHDATQIANVAESIRQFGWTQPLVVDAAGVLVIGHCRFLAAQQMGLDQVPCVCVDDLSPEQVNALRLVDNKTNESPWDLDLLAEELPELDLSGFDFEWGLPDQLKDGVVEDDYDPNPPAAPKSKPGQVYQLGRHRLMCGDSTSTTDVQMLTGGGTGGLASYRSTLQCGLFGDRREDGERRYVVGSF